MEEKEQILFSCEYFMNKGPKIIKNILRFFLRYKWLLKFGIWLLKKQPRISSKLLKMADLTTPYVPPKPLKIGNRSKADEQLSESARNIYYLLKESLNEKAEKNLHLEEQQKDSKISKLAFICLQQKEISESILYYVNLLRALTKYYEITLVTDNRVIISTLESLNLNRVSLNEFRQEANKYSRRLFFLSEDVDYGQILTLIKKYPGTLILENLFFGQALLGCEENTPKSKDFLKALYNSHGYSALLFRGEKGVDETIKRYPCSGELIQATQGIIGTSEEIPKLIDSFFSIKGIEQIRYIPKVKNAELTALQYYEAIEYFTLNHPAAKIYRQISQAALKYAGRTPDEKELILLAEEISENRPFSGLHQLLVDISVIAQGDSKTGIQRVSHNILRQLIIDPPSGYRVEPVYRSDGLYRYARRYMIDFLQIEDTGLKDEPVDVQSGDVFLGLDLTLDMETADREWLVHHSKRGLKLYFVLHDILPLIMPDCFRPQVELITKKWLVGVTEIADGIICVSQSTAYELGKWLDFNPVERNKPLKIGYFHHGADIEINNKKAGISQKEEEFLSTLAKKTAILMVGTLEPRKGYNQALSAFEKLWESGEDILLMIVGKPGWRTESLIKNIRKHPEQGRHLFWFENAGDEFLVKLYRSSSALLMASFGEGFGLPLIEAARNGLPLIARDLPVFHEVVGERAYYFKASNGQELFDALKKWAKLYSEGKHPCSEGIKWQTWKESAKQLKKVIFESGWIASWEPESGFEKRNHSCPN